MREFPLPQEILKLFEREPRRTFRLRDLVVELGIRSSQARLLKKALKDLARNRRITYLKNNQFALASRGQFASAERPEHPAPKGREIQRPRGANIVSGRLIGHRDGYGFVVPDKPLAGTDMDIYIPRDGLSSALHGDRVEVQVLRAKADGRVEGRIVHVAQRAQNTVVGQFHCGSKYNYVMPYDHRIPFEIIIPRGQEWPEGEAPEAESAVPTKARRRDRQFGGESESHGALVGKLERRSVRDLEGLIVDVELTTFPRPAALPRGRVLEILGRREEFGVDVEIMIRKFHLPHRFPAEVLAEASAAPQYIPERDREGRRDFRDLPIITIDGETAKDFDDAVYVERLATGNYLLHVHIADVAHYVRPGSALDQEARLRGTSVYFPDRAVPMLPLDLSNGICSLNPHGDRLVMSALMEIDPAGHVLQSELLPGIIRSSERMTYTAVRDILEQDIAACQRYPALVPHIKLMEELALILNRRRVERGSIDFDLPEPLIEFDEFGRMVGITRSERNFAHRIIEEFMLAANEAVAGYLEDRGIPSLYRVHQKPDPKKVLEFEEIAATFGYSLGVEMPAGQRLRVAKRGERDRHTPYIERTGVTELKITPRHYQRLTRRLEGKPEERILSYLMLRSLKQARYSEENIGHFALAAETYTHFTSPIRRYPDLIVHRILKATLAQEGGRARVAAREAETTTRGAERTDLGEPRLRRDRKGRLAQSEPSSAIASGSSHLVQGQGRRESQSWLALRQPPVSGHALPGGAFISTEELHALGSATSESERRAADAERELMEWKKVAFMAQHVGDDFDALIISLVKFGFFVELTDLFVEGFVALASLGDDYYVYRERERAIVGQHNHRAFHLGERVRVRLDRIDTSGNRLEFSIAD